MLFKLFVRTTLHELSWRSYSINRLRFIDKLGKNGAHCQKQRILGTIQGVFEGENSKDLDVALEP